VERAAETGLRSFGEREILRVAARDVLDLADVHRTGAALSQVAESIIGAALGQLASPIPVAVIGMGRFGGRELAYSSDLDLRLVYDVPPGWDQAEAAAAADSISSSLRRLLGGSTPATGLYRVDFDLRPEGRQGPTARSLEAYALYYERWAQPWERQALLRGRYVAGDAELGERFAMIARNFLWDRPLRPEDVVEIRRIKARMERERVPAGEDPKFHLKLGPGSLSDVEWTVQLLQLEHGVQATGTLGALEELVAAHVVTPADGDVLAEAYRFCERTRNRLALMRDVPGDALPTTGPALSKLARSLGRSGSELRNDYTRVTRRSRRVVEKLFYGRDPG
jgi:glutamate-ammonia-ligase adenylyltransferase